MTSVPGNKSHGRPVRREKWHPITPSHPKSDFELPVRWKTPRRIQIHEDLFEGTVSEGLIAKILSVVARTPRHTFELTTCDAARQRILLSAESFTSEVLDNFWNAPPPALWYEPSGRISRGPIEASWQWPLKNLQLGVRVSDQASLEEQIPELLKTAAAGRFVHITPVGPIDFKDYLWRDEHIERVPSAAINLISVSGEVGRQARPMHPDWVRTIRDQSVAASVAFYFQGWGEWAPGDIHNGGVSGGAPPAQSHSVRRRPVGYLDYEGKWHNTNELNTFQIPSGWERMARVGRRVSGRELDGRRWDGLDDPNENVARREGKGR